MKTKFTKEYVLANKGCYSEEQVNGLPFDRNGEITIEKLHKVLPIKDFSWFLAKKCELTLEQKRRFALHCAKQVLPIFEKKYPNSNRVRACIEATEGYLNGTVTHEELIRERDAATYAAYAAAYAAADAYAYSKSILKFVKNELK